MNIFQLAGDFSHMLSKLILVERLLRHRNAHGISLKTQELYLIVFCLRYLDLFTSFYSVYNSAAKIFYIGCTSFIVYSVRRYTVLRDTYDATRDSFPHWTHALLPCIMVAWVWKVLPYDGSVIYDWQIIEIAWTVSIVLESVCMVPQLFLIFQYREGLESLQWIYKFIFFSGIYRALYICNWMYKSSRSYFPSLVSVCAVVQTLIYLDFLHFYVRRASLVRTLTLHSAFSDVARENEDSDNDDVSGHQYGLLLDNVEHDVPSTEMDARSTGEELALDCGETLAGTGAPLPSPVFPIV